MNQNHQGGTDAPSENAAQFAKAEKLAEQKVTFTARLRECMEAAEFTQEALTLNIKGVGSTKMSRWLDPDYLGKGAIPYGWSLWKIGEILQCSHKYLTGETDDPTPDPPRKLTDTWNDARTWLIDKRYENIPANFDVKLLKHAMCPQWVTAIKEDLEGLTEKEIRALCQWVVHRRVRQDRPSMRLFLNRGEKVICFKERRKALLG